MTVPGPLFPCREIFPSQVHDLVVKKNNIAVVAQEVVNLQPLVPLYEQRGLQLRCGRRRAAKRPVCGTGNVSDIFTLSSSRSCQDRICGA